MSLSHNTTGSVVFGSQKSSWDFVIMFLHEESVASNMPRMIAWVKGDKGRYFKSYPWNVWATFRVERNKNFRLQVCLCFMFCFVCFDSLTRFLLFFPVLCCYVNVLSHVYTWCPSTVLVHDYRWALMWTHRFFKDLPQNSGPVSVPECKVETLYSDTKVGVYILGTQCLNTASFCAGAQALVLEH